MKRTLDNCSLIELLGVKPNQYNGKCLGYARAGSDDEPFEVCKKCKLNTSYEDEDEDE